MERRETTTPGHAGSLDAYQTCRSMLEQRIEEAISQTTPAELRMAVRHAALGGKRIRPLLTLISTLAVGGRPDHSIDAAVAVELLHASSLVHDDIMDSSELRRGKAAVHTKFGRSMAILAGDTLIALAFRSILRTHQPHTARAAGVLTEALAETCEGQGYDIVEGERRNTERERDHLMMVEKKTARLIEAAAALGGLLGGASAGSLEALKGFGYNIGMAYQAKDDLLDVIATEEVTGKSVGVDPRNGRTTFATMACGDCAEISTIVSDYTVRAFSHLDQLPPSIHRENLKTLAGSLVGRSM